MLVILSLNINGGLGHTTDIDKGQGSIDSQLDNPSNSTERIPFNYSLAAATRHLLLDRIDQVHHSHPMANNFPIMDNLLVADFDDLDFDYMKFV